MATKKTVKKKAEKAASKLGGMSGRAAGLLRGRGRQIDSIVNAASGAPKKKKKK